MSNSNKFLESNFRIFLISILAFSLALRLFALRNNNFYFTMDQARDAIAVRQILKGRLTLKGPTTAIKDFYAGPLWYYFISIGYLFSFGHPIGPVLFLIFVNLAAIALAMFVLKKKVNLATSLTVGLGLSILSPFLQTSWYAFNPHLLPFICLSLIISLCLFNKMNQYFFIFSALAVGLTFHSEIAFVLPLLLLFLAFGLYQIFAKKIDLVVFFSALVVLACFLIPHLFSELANNFSQTKSLFNEINSRSGYFSQINYTQQGREVLKEILKLTSQSTIGYDNPLTSIIFIISTLVFLFSNLVHSSTRQRHPDPELVEGEGSSDPATAGERKNAAFGLDSSLGFGMTKNHPRQKVFDFKFKFVFLTFIIWLTSILWFSTNKGLASWHLVGLPPTIFVSFFLSLTFLKNKIALGLQLLFLISHLISFSSNWQHYFKLSDDQSILQNELKAIDWVYEKSENKGFKVYTFLPSVYDYPYQYLFPWYGKKKFGYLPCEYSTYPGISASTYVNDSKDYQEKEKQCTDGLLFLIIEPPVEKSVLDQWCQEVTKQSELIEKAKVGKITLEKRRKT